MSSTQPNIAVSGADAGSVAPSEMGIESLSPAPSTRWRRRWFPTFHAIYRWWAKRLTRSGRVLFALLLISLPGAFTEQRFSLQVIGALTATYVGVGWMGRRHRPRLTVRLSMQESVSCGQLAELRVTLKNESDRACYGLRTNVDLTEEDVWQFDPASQPQMPVIDLEPGEQASGVLFVRPRVRGRFSLPSVRITSTFPLNLMLQSQHVQTQAEVVVTPARESFHVAESMTGGASLLATVPDTVIQQGDSWEYYGSREYQQGMAVRRWDYGAWARLGKPYIREFEEQTQANAAVLVDAFSTSAQPNDPLIEAAVSLAAGLIQSLLQDRWQVHLLLAPGADPYVQWEPSPHAKGILMEKLAELKPADESFQAMDERAATTTLPFWEMTIFIVLAQWDQDRAEWCDQWRHRGADVRILAPRSVQQQMLSAPKVRLVETPYCRAAEKGAMQ